MKELTQSGADSQLQGVSGTRSHTDGKGGGERRRQGASKELTLQGPVTKPRPGLHNAAHLFTSACPTRVCKRAPQHSTYPDPPSLASKPGRLGLNKLD